MKSGVMMKATNVIKASEVETRLQKFMKSPLSSCDMLMHAVMASSKHDV